MKLVFNDYTEEDLIYVYSLSFSHTIRTILTNKNISSISESSIYNYIYKVLNHLSSRLIIEIFDATIKLLKSNSSINIISNYN